MKIITLVPCGSEMPSMTAYSLAQMQAQTVAAFSELQVQVGMAMEIGTYIHQARQSLLQAAIADGADFVLWVDSDMTFPEDAVVRLLAHKHPVVGINYSQRAFPPDFTAVKRMPRKRGEIGQKLVTGPDSEGLEEVDAMGFGLVLMEVAALAKLPDPDNVPWFFFEQRWPGDHVGEDVWFCRLLREMCGLTLYVDHDLSRECGHVGQYEYRTFMAAQARAEGLFN